MATHQAWRDTPQWRATRKAALERDGQRCTRCGRGREDGTRLHVDHIVRVSDGGEAFDLTNCQTLCARCHGKKSGAETAADNRARAKNNGGYRPAKPRGNCRNCGRTLVGKDARNVYCSEGCDLADRTRRGEWRIEWDCRVCGETSARRVEGWEAPQPNPSTTQTCSAEHGQDLNAMLMRDRHREKEQVRKPRASKYPETRPHTVRVEQTREVRTTPTPIPEVEARVSEAEPALPRSFRKISTSKTLTGKEPSGEPRFLSDPHPNRAGSRGEEWGRWMKATFGESPRPFQARVADRMLEVDAEGLWCWSAFVTSVPRQQGKSWMLRGILAWMASQGLLVVATTNRLRTAGEIIRPLGRWAMSNGGVYHRAIDQPAVEWPTGGGRLVFQAATDALAVGWSPDAAAVDEAWDVPMIPVTQGLVPAMSDKDNPILMFTSTVGLTTSELLNRYRSYALSGEEAVGIAEWSAAPGTDWLDEETWRQATPEWSPKRLKFLRQQSKMLSESHFRSQFLNQTVHAEDSWVAPSRWAAAAADRKPAISTGGVVAVEITLDGSMHYVIHAVRDSEGIVRVALHAFRTFREVDHFIARVARPTTVLAPGIYRDRLSRLDKVVGSSDVSAAMPIFLSALNDGRVVHPSDERLTEQVLMARAHVTKAGAQTLVASDGRPLSAMRALLWAVASESEQTAGRPKLRVAR